MPADGRTPAASSPPSPASSAPHPAAVEGARGRDPDVVELHRTAFGRFPLSLGRLRGEPESICPALMSPVNRQQPGLRLYRERDQLAAGDPAELLWIVHEEPVLGLAVGGKHGHESPVVV